MLIIVVYKHKLSIIVVFRLWLCYEINSWDFALFSIYSFIKNPFKLGYPNFYISRF